MAFALGPASTLTTGLRNQCTLKPEPRERCGDCARPEHGHRCGGRGGIVNDAAALALAVLGGPPA